jgi:hypothetical protein
MVAAGMFDNADSAEHNGVSRQQPRDSSAALDTVGLPIRAAEF